MRSTLAMLALGVLCAALSAVIPAWAAEATDGIERIERIEPPSWWVGMREPRLQLMVHGPGIGRFTPAVQATNAATAPAPGVRVVGHRSGDSPNYLFVDLELARDAAPGPVTLVFTQGERVIHRGYLLQPRAAGSAERRGFDSADVILNLVPDRFANGDPANDDQPGFPDRARRADVQAGRHGGDLQGLAEHLDYLAGMGYTMLWPTPLVENNQPRYSYHGYAATDLYRIDPRFGSNAQYVRLVAQARAKGLGVIQDVVLNHIGSAHWWMRDLPMRDWLTHGGRFAPTRHARTALSDPYAAPADRDDFTQGWFTEDMPDLNQRNPQLATYLVQNAIWWVETAGLAGLRVDTYGYSDTAFLAQWSRALTAEYPRLGIVGEEWSGNPVVVARWQRGQQGQRFAVAEGSALPSLMDFPLHYVLRRALAAEDGWNGGLQELYEALVNDRLYADPMAMVLFEGNHDVPRLFSALGEDLALAKMAIAYVLTMRGIPQLYYGTELLMTSPRERDDGATRQDFPGGWPGDAVNARTGAGLTPAQREMQAFMRRLMTWRRTQPAIHHGRLMHYAPDRGTYAWFRYDDRSQVMVVLNKNRREVALDTRRFAERLGPAARGTDVLTGESLDLARTLTLPPRSVRVIEVATGAR